VPAPISINPFCPHWLRVGQRQIKDRDCLTHLSSHTNGDDQVALGDIDLGDRHFLAKHLGHAWKSEVFLDHYEEPARLL